MHDASGKNIWLDEHGRLCGFSIKRTAWRLLENGPLRCRLMRFSWESYVLTCSYDSQVFRSSKRVLCFALILGLNFSRLLHSDSPRRRILAIVPAPALLLAALVVLQALLTQGHLLERFYNELTVTNCSIISLFPTMTFIEESPKKWK